MWNVSRENPVSCWHKSQSHRCQITINLLLRTIANICFDFSVCLSRATTSFNAIETWDTLHVCTWHWRTPHKKLDFLPWSIWHEAHDKLSTAKKWSEDYDKILKVGKRNAIIRIWRFQRHVDLAWVVRDSREKDKKPLIGMQFYHTEWKQLRKG